MESFAGFLYIVVVRWLFECSWSSSSGLSGSLIRTLEMVLDQHKSSSLNGKLIKQHPLIYSGVWHVRDIAIVAP